MCLALSKPAGKIVPKAHLENGFHGNSDGAGFAVALPERKLLIKKGFFKFEEFYQAYLPYEKLPCLIHFRIGTSGKKDMANCHPWRLTENVALIHNGILPLQAEGDWSDTGIFSRLVMAPHFEHMPKDWWKGQSFKWLFEEAIGIGNKIAIMDNEGEVVILNESGGEWDNGVWYSNTGYKWKRGITHYDSRHQGEHDEYFGHLGNGRFHRHSTSTSGTPASDHERWKETSIPHVYVLKQEYANRWPKPGDKEEVKEAEVVETTVEEPSVPPVIPAVPESGTQPTSEQIEAQALTEVEAREIQAMKKAGYTQQEINSVIQGP